LKVLWRGNQWSYALDPDDDADPQEGHDDHERVGREVESGDLVNALALLSDGTPEMRNESERDPRARGKKEKNCYLSTTCGRRKIRRRWRGSGIATRIRIIREESESMSV